MVVSNCYGFDLGLKDLTVTSSFDLLGSVVLFCDWDLWWWTDEWVTVD